MTDAGRNVITSRQNPKVTDAAKLQDKKYRDETGLFMAEGIKLCAEALKSSLEVRRIFLLEDRLDALEGLLSEIKGKTVPDIVYVSAGVFEKISTEKAPEGIIAIAEKPLALHSRKEPERIAEEIADEMVFALFSVRDAGNLGTALRSAYAFGYDRIVISADCADIYNTKTLRSSMGALFAMKISITRSMGDFVRECRKCGRRVFAAQKREGALSLKGIKPEKSDIFIIGNEANGIPDEISKECDAQLYIPISSKCESLNASAAAAVLMWEQGQRFTSD